MFEFFSDVAAAWREVEHISEWTGLSVGMLAVLGAVIYFDPTARKLAIRIAVLVFVGYWLGIYFYHLGAGDVRAQWAAANLKEAAKAELRDSSIEKQLTTDNPAPTAADQKQAETDEANVLAAVAGAAGVPCQLGADALRLRH
jgi:hypothetical protein